MTDIRDFSLDTDNRPKKVRRCLHCKEREDHNLIRNYMGQFISVINPQSHCTKSYTGVHEFV